MNVKGKAKERSSDDYLYITSLIVVAILLVGALLYQKFLKDFISLPTCFFYSHYGIFCPGCGCTRAFVSLLKGNFIVSFLYNPTVIYAAIMTLIYLLTQTIKRITKGKTWALSYQPFYVYLGITILMGTCLFKNMIYLIS